MLQKEELIHNHFTKYKSWLFKAAFKLCKNNEQAKDMISHLKLRLLEMTDDEVNKIKHKNELNNFYLYKMVKSEFLNDTRKSPWFVEFEFDKHDVIDEEYGYKEDEYIFDQENTVVHFFNVSGSREDVILFKKYIEEDLSLEQLSIQSGINKSKLWTTFDKLKKEIKVIYNVEFKGRWY